MYLPYFLKARAPAQMTSAFVEELENTGKYKEDKNPQSTTWRQPWLKSWVYVFTDLHEEIFLLREQHCTVRVILQPAVSPEIYGAISPHQ